MLKTRKEAGTMSRQFNVAQLVRVAVVDERSGEELYRKMAVRAHEAELEDLFLQLSEQEVGHRQRFEKLLEQVQGEGAAQYPDEYVDYLELLSGQGGQSEAHQALGRATTAEQVLNLAIRFEKDQLALQQEIADALGETHREVAETVIQEKRSHLVRLNAAKRRLISK
jgi:rubrerythrin